MNNCYCAFIDTDLVELWLTMSREEEKGIEGTGVQMALSPGFSNPVQTSCVELSNLVLKQSKVPQLWKNILPGPCESLLYLPLPWNFLFTSRHTFSSSRYTHILLLISNYFSIYAALILLLIASLSKDQYNTFQHVLSDWFLGSP